MVFTTMANDADEEVGIKDDGLAYEVDEKGERVLVKSLRSNQRVYLRFTNRTSRTVDIWWRSFRGSRVRYGRLKPRMFLDASSYITHPWEFTDVTTKENYVIENKKFFRPPVEIADKGFRINWNITIGVRTLRNATLLMLASYITDPDAVDNLPLPSVLINDLRETIVKYHKTVSPISGRIDRVNE